MRKPTILWLAAAVLLAGCESPLETSPTDAIGSDEALTNARGIELAVTGAYRSLQDDESGALYDRELTVYPELYADNLRYTGTYSTDAEVANRNLTADNVAIETAWEAMYEGINQANNVLVAIPGVEDLSEAEARQYRGEALFIRALHYFNLVRYFGGVPIVTEPVAQLDPAEVNVSRASAEEVYALIESDLEEASTLLAPAGNSIRATAMAANALLARVHLEQGEWVQARENATQVIESGNYRLVANYLDLFETENGPESILEVQYTINNGNNQAFWYYPQSLGGRMGYVPTDELYEAYEAGDERRDASIGAADGELFGNKFTDVANGSDNVFVLRLGEMYLIRAEANARLGADPAVVRADINVVRNRAGLPDLPTTVDTEAELIGAILQERRLEFAFEGFRFFDLRRTGRAQEVLGITATQLLFPIPQSELDVNPELVQNPGY